MRDISSLRAVNLGAGDNKTPEQVTVDLRAETNPDIVADVSEPLPFPDGRFDEVYSSHTLEHISWQKTRAALKEWVRILAPGGTIKIIVPNIAVAAQYFEQPQYYGTSIGILYGAQDYEWNYHKTGFVDHYLKMLLEEQGIEVHTIEKGGYDLIEVGRKK